MDDLRDLQLRSANAADLDALVALEEAVFDYDRLSRRQYRRHLANPRALLLVATQDGALLGAGLVFFRAGARHARVYSLAIAPAARGKGVGRRLLDALENGVRQRGLGGIRLEVRTDNAGAIRLYESAGYHRFGERRHYYDDGADAACYQKEL